jgi:hypothetical protein
MFFILGAFTVKFNELNNLPKFAEYAGFPLIPYKLLVINLAEDERISGIRLKSLRQREINYRLDFALKIDTPGSQPQKTYLPEIYPKDVVFVGNQGFFRGNRLAFLIVSAIQVKNGKVYLNEEISFEVLKERDNARFSRPRYSDWRIWEGSFKLLGIPQKSSFIPQDRVDMAIITTENLKPYWKRLMDFRNSMGIRTEIYTVEWISSNFPGTSIPTKIRNFLKYLYENFGLSALLIGADPQEVPPLRTNVPLFYDTLSGYGSGFRDFLLTDFYYSALDGEWNTNGDRWDGGWGDTLDLIPDILVGRVPFSSQENVINYINSLIEYETARNFDSPYFAFFGSNLFGDTLNPDSADGCLIAQYISNALTRIPTSQKIMICSRSSATLRDTLNFYKPVMVFGIGHSNHRYILTRYSSSVADALDYRRLDELNFKFIASWIGCFINDPFSNSVGLEAVKRGKAVASVGASKADFILSEMIWRKIYDSINVFAGYPHLGVVVNYGKIEYSSSAMVNPLFRYLLFAYNIIGDPTVRIFNENRHKILISYTVSDTIITFNALDSLTLSPKPLVKISLSDSRTVVAEGITNLSGNVSFILKRNDTLNWSAWHPSSLIYTGRISANYEGYYLRIDSVSLSSNNDTTDLMVWIKNLGSSSTILSPTLSSPDFFVLSSPYPSIIPPRSSVRFIWRVYRNQFSSNKYSKVKVNLNGYWDSAYVWIGGPRLVFHSAKWRYFNDTLILLFDVSNSGNDTAFNVRVVVDSSSLIPIGGNQITRLAPGEFSSYSLQFVLRGPFPYGQFLRFRLYAGPVMYGFYRVRIDTPNVSITDYSTEPVNRGVILRWGYAGDSTKRYSWRVYVDGRPVDLDTLTGSNFTYITQEYVVRRFSVTVVQDGIEGDTVFSTFESPNPTLHFAKDIDYIFYSAYPRYSFFSGPVFAQLVPNTAEPEMVTASAFNRLYALRLDGSEIWRANLSSWIETFPVIADVDGDKFLDVLIATTYEIYALKGSDGSLIWKVRLPYFPGRPDSTPIPMYLMVTKGEIGKNIVLISRRGSVFVYNSSGMLLNYRLNSADPNSVSPPATYDFDGDGIWEIAVKVGDSLYLFSQNLKNYPNFPIRVQPSKWLLIWDFTGDGEPEILTCGHKNTLVSYVGDILLVDSSAYNPNGYCIPVDFNGDGKFDVVQYHPLFASSSPVRVYSVDTQFVLLSSFPEDANLRGRMASTVDINNDGKGEIIISDARSYLHAYSEIRRDFYGFPIDLSDHNRFRSNTVYSIPSAVEYGNHLYIFAPTEANKLYSWKIYGGKVVWGMPFYNRWATNSPIDSLPDEVSVVALREEKKEKNVSVEFGRDEIRIFGKAWVSVYSVDGRRLIKEYVNGQKEIKLDLPRGIYMVKVGKRVFKFLKK